MSIIDILIMLHIRKMPLDSPDIIHKIKEKFGVSITFKTLHSTLLRLQNENIITLKKKLYYLTSKGKVSSKSLITDYFEMQKILQLSLKK